MTTADSDTPLKRHATPGPRVSCVNSSTDTASGYRLPYSWRVQTEPVSDGAQCEQPRPLLPRAEHWTALPLELTLLARHYDRK